MKKIKVTVKPGCAGKKFLLFPDAETAYVWLKDEPGTAPVEVSIEEVKLEPHEFIEAEWRGCEYAYENNEYQRLNLIRFAKAHVPQNSSGIVASVYYGWVTDKSLPFREHEDDDIVISVLSDEKCKINLEAMFEDDMYDDEQEDVVK